MYDYHIAVAIKPLDSHACMCVLFEYQRDEQWIGADCVCGA